MRYESAIIEQQKQSKFVCSGCGSARDCDCAAPALERLAEKKENERQAAKAYRERKKEEKSTPPSYDAAKRAEARCDTQWKKFEETAEEESDAVDFILVAIRRLTDEQRSLLFETLKDSYQWKM